MLELLSNIGWGTLYLLIITLWGILGVTVLDLVCIFLGNSDKKLFVDKELFIYELYKEKDTAGILALLIASYFWPFLAIVILPIVYYSKLAQDKLVKYCDVYENVFNSHNKTTKINGVHIIKKSLVTGKKRRILVPGNVLINRETGLIGIVLNVLSSSDEIRVFEFSDINRIKSWKISACLGFEGKLLLDTKYKTRI